RKRISKACDQCRRRKAKCDFSGSGPCSGCTSAGIECQFTKQSKKRGPPKGYIEVIESRLEKMEA
ncbi:hypothetical protein GQ42DRAFT_102895, partial [Ramicandelaber brevisporus]